MANTAMPATMAKAKYSIQSVILPTTKIQSSRSLTVAKPAVYGVSGDPSQLPKWHQDLLWLAL
jgi:hypothetical protein